MATERVPIGWNLDGLKPGDIVEFDRGPYSHFGIYSGEETVIHLHGGFFDVLGPSSSSGKLYDDAIVSEDKIKVVAHSLYSSWSVYKHNYMDEEVSPLCREEIVKRARGKIGRGQYNLLFNNCEHFATWCRYDVNRSQQVRNLAMYVGVGAVAVAVGLGYYATTPAGKVAFAAARNLAFNAAAKLARNGVAAMVIGKLSYAKSGLSSLLKSWLGWIWW